jgi:hypothetical protein
MNSDNFNKLFTDEHLKAKAAFFDKLPTFQRAKLVDPNTPKDEKGEVIEQNQEPIPAELQNEIQTFIQAEKKKGTKQRSIRRMVKRKFNIMVV